jgi:hypothetical protein
LASHENIGGFPKYRRISKILSSHEILADVQNVGALQNIGGCTKCWRLAEIKAGDRILAGIKISVPGEISADLEKVGSPLTVWARLNLQLLTSSWTG